jgi:hypothetical protein
LISSCPKNAFYTLAKISNTMKKIFAAATSVLLLGTISAQISQMARKEMEWDDEGVSNTTSVDASNLY